MSADLGRVVYFDLEATGTDPQSDRIVEMGFVDTDGAILLDVRVNPERPIPKEAQEVHGISDADVAGLEPFRAHAEVVQRIVEGATLVAYNGIRYDAPLLDRELRQAGRAGLDKDDQGRIASTDIDPYGLWARLEPRSLDGALGRFGVEEYRGETHSAIEDAAYLRLLLDRMVEVFDLHGVDLAELSRPEGSVDRDGKFVRREDGKVVFNFGKHRGYWVGSELGFLEWMIEKDFSDETKSFARYYLEAVRSRGGT